jgi:hypothetical protein
MCHYEYCSEKGELMMMMFQVSSADSRYVANHNDDVGGAKGLSTRDIW